MKLSVQKWDPKIRVYEPYEAPPLANIMCPLDDMSAMIQCARCGRLMRCGEGFTSKQIHTKVGFGYLVDEDCYQEEWEEEMAARTEG